jgi:SSS family solute:Na+ symporter
VYGGLSPVAWTDFIQVIVLLVGGFIVTFFGLNALSDGQGAWTGFIHLMETSPEKFHTVLGASHPDLPWPGVFLGGLWIAALSYWGCNQYIIQRALAARSLRQAQYGLVFASFVSLIVSVIIVLPGIIASALFGDIVNKADQAYPTLVRQLIPVGYMGLIIAALFAAIISSLNSMTNSAATIFTMDVYRKIVRRSASDKELVRVGRLASAVGLAIAVLIAPRLEGFAQVFQFIQEYTGFVTPGVFAIFVFALSWKRTTSGAALAAALLTIPVSAVLKVLLSEVGFLNRMGITFLILSAVIVLISLGKHEPETSHAEFAGVSSQTPLLFNVLALAMVGTIAALYLYFW